MRCRSGAGLLARSVCLAFSAVGLLYAQTELPDAPARDTVKKICSGCHEMESVISSRRTKIGWQQITEDMISRGAEGSDAEMAAVVAYLTEWFGKINVNTATAAEIEKTLALPGKEAQAIAAWREHNGKIKNFEELEKVPGVEPEKLRQKRSLIAFSQ
jgi:competence ComEA-like helix-hairpin-helix protein